MITLVVVIIHKGGDLTPRFPVRVLIMQLHHVSHRAVIAFDLVLCHLVVIRIQLPACHPRKTFRRLYR